MAIQLFQPKYRNIQSPIDLNTLANTYNTLEAKHLQALELRAKYGEALQALPLHPNEDAWVAQRNQAINNAFSENLRYGNAAASLDDLVKTWGDIKSDPALKGRLRANQEYQDYITNLEANKTLDEDTKAYYREKNKYYYQDTYDKAGNIIGGTEWKPLEQEVNHVPENLIWEQARKWVAEEKGGGQEIMFLDANGNPTPNFADSPTGAMLYKTDTGWSRVPEDKLRAAIDAAIKSIPGAQASLDQRYKVAKWKYENGKSTDILDKNGSVMTPSQYLENMINPFVQAATYHNKVSKIEYGDAWKSHLLYKQAQGGLTGGTAAQSTSFRGNVPSYRSNPILVKNNAPIEAQAVITSGRQELSNILRKYNPDLSIDLNTADNKTIYDTIIKNVTNSEDLAKAISNYHDIVDNQAYITSITEGKDPVDVANFETFNAINSMSDLPDTIASKEYSEISNYIYGGNEKIRQYLSEEEYNAFINNIGDSNLNKYGIVAGRVGNNFYVDLDKKNDKSLYIYSKTINDVTGGYINEAYDVAAGWLTNSRRNGLYRVDSNGNENRVDAVFPALRDKITGRAMATVSPIKSVVSYVDGLNRSNERVLDGAMIPISNIAIAEPTPEMAELAMLVKNDPENYAAHNAAYTKAKTEFQTAARGGIDMTQANGYLLGENNMFEEMTSEQRKDYTAILRSTKAEDIIPSIVRDPITGGVAIQITIPGKLEDKDTDDPKARLKVKPITFIAGSGSYQDEILSAWERDSGWKANAKLENYFNAKRPLSLTNDEAFTGIDKTKLVPTESGFVSTNANNIPLVSFDKSSAANAVKVLSEWEETYLYLKAGGQFAEQALQYIIDNTARALCQINGESEEYLEYYKSILNKNIGR